MVVGRVALVSVVVFALVACSARVPVELPAAETVTRAIGDAVASPEPVPAPRGAAAVAPRAASAAERAFPFGEPRAEWVPANAFNYDRGRRGARVQFVVIHYTVISYDLTLRAFRSPASRVSSHYVVRGDGHIAQMVSEDDNAWHAGNAWYNFRSVGIELELNDRTNPAFTAEQYYAAAGLACGIAARHGVPLDRAHIVGHNEIPGSKKLDPGPTWGWPHFMWLTSLCAPPSAGSLHASFVSQSDYPAIPAGGAATVTVTLRNTGSIAWRKRSSTEVRLGVPANDRKLAFLGEGWPLPERPAVQSEELVAPGGTATFTFTVKGSIPGSFVIPLRPVVDGVAWMEDQGIHMVVTVREP